MPPRERRIDHRQDFEALDTIYKRFELDGRYQVPNSPAEPRLEPPPGAENDPWFLGKEIAVRVTKFIALCAPSFQAEPDQIYFATELAALNVFNALDSPISEAKRERARQAAYDYYIRSLDQIPNAR